MNRLKALYRSWAIPCAGEQVYAPRHRAEWLAKITEPGVRRRAEFYYQQFDALAAVRQEARRELLSESRKHSATKLLRPDSLDRTHSRSSVDCFDPNATPLPHQAATLGLLRPGAEDLHQRGIPLRRRSTPTLQKGPGHSRAQQKSSSRSEKYLQGRRHALRVEVWPESTSNSLLKNAFEPAVASTVRNYSSPKANKKKGSSSLLSSKSRTETVFQQAAKGLQPIFFSTRDVSTLGFYFESEQDFPVGSRFNFSIIFPHEITGHTAAFVNGLARTVRIERTPKDRLGVGLLIESYKIRAK